MTVRVVATQVANQRVLSSIVRQLRWRNGISNTHDVGGPKQLIVYLSADGKALSDSAFAGSAQAFNNKLVLSLMVLFASRTECCEFVIIVRADSAIGLSLTACKQMAMPLP